MFSKCLHLCRDIKVTVIFLSNINKHGNKYYKLKYNISNAKEKGLDILTFGGAYSNHLIAVADIGNSMGVKTNAIIRGERPLLLSETLIDAEKLGMKLHFISRSNYRKKNDPIFLNELHDQFNNCFIIPEGGSNFLGLKGVNEIINDINLIQPNFDTIILPVATGGTLAGIATSLDSNKNIIGILVLKGNNHTDNIESNINNLINSYNDINSYTNMKINWTIDNRFHCGGYAKCPNYLKEFIINFEKEHDLIVDPVYTGKLFYGLHQMISNNELVPNSNIVVLHTGGQQGRRGYLWLN